MQDKQYEVSYRSDVHDSLVANVQEVPAGKIVVVVHKRTGAEVARGPSINKQPAWYSVCGNGSEERVMPHNRRQRTSQRHRRPFFECGLALRRHMCDVLSESTFAVSTH